MGAIEIGCLLLAIVITKNTRKRDSHNISPAIFEITLWYFAFICLIYGIVDLVKQ